MINQTLGLTTRNLLSIASVIRPRFMSSATTKLEPLFDRVLVKKDEPEAQTKGGIMLPENQNKTHNGTVVAVGAGARNRDGGFHKPMLKIGDKVMLPEYGGNKVDISGHTHYVYRESDIIGKWL